MGERYYGEPQWLRTVQLTMLVDALEALRRRRRLQEDLRSVSAWSKANFDHFGTPGARPPGSPFGH